jgi:phosphoserine phosphatase
VRTVSVKEVICAIDEARAREPGGAIAFDGDGTLWAGDIGEDFFEAMLARGLHETARDALVREALAENIDASGTPGDIARRIHAAYVAGTFPERRVCEIMTWVAAGLSRTELDGFCAEVIVAVGLRDRLHEEALAVLQHARRVGIDVYLVSASPRAIVERGAEVVGIDLANTMAAREACDAAGIVACAVERPIPYGPGKVEHLRERIGQNRVLYAAFGDNAFDVPMLQEARVPVAVRPKKRLVDRAGEVPSLVILHRA